MPIQFACIHCDQRLSVSEKKVGAQVKCPQCKAALTVPDAEEAESILAERRRRRDAEKENPFSQFAVYDEETEIVYEQDVEAIRPTLPAAKEGIVDPSRVAVPRIALYLQGGLLAAVAIVAFALGLFVGGAFAPPTSPPAATGPHVVTGALYFQGPGQATAPDADAVVVLLPADARPEQRPDGEHLGPAEPPPEADDEALRAIRQIGGVYARTTAEGRFQVSVPRGGRYYVLFISREKSQSESLDPGMLAHLGGYFENASELIGNHAHHWREEQLRGDRTLTHVFP